MAKTTSGDNYNISCPHCGRNNNYVCQGQTGFALGKMVKFEKPCFHCKKVIVYHAGYEIKVVAYEIDPLKE